jgi:DNA end-binding protein Ku
MLHKKCGSRIKNQLYCATDDEVIHRADVVKGYEYARGQFVQFTEEELKALETERSSSIEIVEFVPLSSVDFVQVERSYYLGPDKGGDKAYQLLSASMLKKDKVAVGKWAARGKGQLVMIRPYGKGGLLLHQLYYADEVRAFDEVDTGATFKFHEKELDLAEKLIEQLSTDEFHPENYKDEYRDRVVSAVEQKVAGEEVTVAPEAPQAQIIDLFEALKKSLSDAKDKDKPLSEGEKALKPPKKAAPQKASRKAAKSE